MTRTAFRRSTSAAIAALLVTAGAAVTVATAHADEKDDNFIEYLDQKGVPYESEHEMVRVAKDFCLDQTRQGQASWVAGYNLTQEQSWTETEAADFINGAVPTYCPKVWG